MPFLLLLALLLTACSGPYSEQKAAAKSEATAMPVDAVRVAAASLPAVVSANGELFAEELANISTKVPGRVTKLNVDLGSLVKAGDVLAELEKDDYQYRLRQTDLDGTVSYSGVREARIESASTGLTNSLGQNVPNPMGNLTQIAFNVVESGKVKVEIVDVFGSVVRTFDVDATAGANSITWEGTDENGVTVPSGTYVYKLVGNGFTLSKKLTVTR